MIKVETMKHENGGEGASVAVTGNTKDLLFEAMSALEGIRQLFEDREHADEYKKIGCGILSGEMHNAWHEVYREKSAALNVLYYLASLIIQEGRRVTWVNLV